MKHLFSEVLNMTSFTMIRLAGMLNCSEFECTEVCDKLVIQYTIFEYIVSLYNNRFL